MPAPTSALAHLLPLPGLTRLPRSPACLLCLPLLLTWSCAGARAPAAGGAATGATSSGAVAASAAGASFPGAGVPAVLSSDFSFISLEGPFWVAAGQDQTAGQQPGGYLLFSDVVEANGAGAAIYKYDPTVRRFSVFPYPGAPATPTSTNGLAVTAAGDLLACERYNGRLVRVSGVAAAGGSNATAGTVGVLADGWPSRGGEGGAAAARLAFNAPNDLAVRSDGNIYFTDSDWGAKPGPGHAPMGVYRLAPGGQLERVMQLEKPNGIALSPDQKTLYVGSDVQAKVWRLPLDDGGAAGAATLMIDGAQVAGGFKVPDGICVDDAGNLYITNNADDVKAIVVFDSSGRSLGRISLPHAPSNCSFGGSDRRILYATTLHAVYEIRMPTPGRP